MILAGVAATPSPASASPTSTGTTVSDWPGSSGACPWTASRTGRCYYPASGQVYFDRLPPRLGVRAAEPDLVAYPVDRDGVVFDGPPFRLVAARSDHRTDTFGWRLKPDGRRMLPERSSKPASGRTAPSVGFGRGGADRRRAVTLEQISEHPPG